MGSSSSASRGALRSALGTPSGNLLRLILHPVELLLLLLLLLMLLMMLLLVLAVAVVAVVGLAAAEETPPGWGWL